MRNNIHRTACALVVFVLCLTTHQASASPRDDQGWIATWATAVSTRSAFDAPTPAFNDVTLRQIVRVSLGGHQLRVWLSNEHGTEPLIVKSASIAQRDVASAVRANSVRPLKFGGRSAITILPGYNSAATNAAREALNHWIRHGGLYDAVADFDRHLRDPEDHGVMRADLTADGLHPNANGYLTMAAVAEAALKRTRR